MPLWHSLCCRNSFPEMHVRPSAPVTFRNVPLPRIKQNKYHLAPCLFSCLLMHTCLQSCPRLGLANSSFIREHLSFTGSPLLFKHLFSRGQFPASVPSLNPQISYIELQFPTEALQRLSLHYKEFMLKQKKIGHI